MTTGEDNAYLKFKINKLTKQNVDLESRCSNLEERLSHLENSMREISKKGPVNGDQINLDSKLNFVENLLKESVINFVKLKSAQNPKVWNPELLNPRAFSQDIIHSQTERSDPILEENLLLEDLDRLRNSVLETELKDLSRKVDAIDSEQIVLKGIAHEHSDRLQTVKSSVEDLQKKVDVNDSKPKKLLQRLVKIEGKIQDLNLPENKSRQKEKNDINKKITTYCQFPPNVSGNVTITSKDYACLESSEFLNDVIIDFYLKYLQKNNPVIETKAHIFSTFFLNRLISKFAPKSEKSDVDEEVYDRVKNWTKNVDLFGKDFVVVPVNEKLHWYLCIICYANYVGENADENSKKSCILVFDSLPDVNDTRSETCQKLRGYLTSEWAAKNPKKSKMIFNDENLPQINLQVQGQKNSKDCGIFLLQYVESFFKDGLNRAWSDPNLSHKDLFSRDIVKVKRHEIAKIIRKLTFEQKKEHKEKIEFPALDFISQTSLKRKLPESPKDDDSNENDITRAFREYCLQTSASNTENPDESKNKKNKVESVMFCNRKC